MHINADERRWFEDMKRPGRYLCMYRSWTRDFQDESEVVVACLVQWVRARPRMASREVNFLLKSLENERYKGAKRFRELEGEELALVRARGTVR